MKNINLFLLLIIIAAMSVTSCTQRNDIEEVSSSQSSEIFSQESTEKNDKSSSQQSQETEPAIISIDYADEKEMENKKSYDHFTEEQYKGSEYLINLMIKTDAKITDVQFMDISISGTVDEKTIFIINNIIYTQDELSPDKPLVISTVFPGDMPTRGISYTDSNGEHINLYISQSGLDGSIIFDRF